MKLVSTLLSLQKTCLYLVKFFLLYPISDEPVKIVAGLIGFRLISLYSQGRTETLL